MHVLGQLGRYPCMCERLNPMRTRRWPLHTCVIRSVVHGPQVSAVSEVKNQLSKDVARAAAARHTLGVRVRQLKLQVAEAASKGRYPQCLRNLLVAHEQGEHG